MSHRIDRNLATRAVDAWLRRLVRVHPDDTRRKLSGFDKEIEQARQRIRDQLVRALVEARIDEGFCQNLEHGRRALARRLGEHTRHMNPRIQQLERLVGMSPAAWRRHRSLINTLRKLVDPDGAAVGGLLHEICLGLSLSTSSRFPWVRR